MVELTEEQVAILETCQPPKESPPIGWMSRKGSGGSIVRVTASAGCGKTTTLLTLAVHAARNCGHEQINYATFTTAAAKDGKERMMKAMAEAARAEESTNASVSWQIPVIEARTLHSFAYRMLEDHRCLKNPDQSSSSLSPPRMWSDKKLKKWIAKVCEDDIGSFLTPCYRELQRRSHSHCDSNADILQSQRQRAYEQVLFFIYKSLVLFTQSAMDIDKFEKDKKIFARDYYPAKCFHNDKKGEDYGFVFGVYNRPDKISFYSDQAAKCWRLIENDDDIRTFDLDMKRVQLLKLKVPGTILLVDESQDMDACQIDFIVHQQAELHHRHVYVVGDPAQAIYGFRGAKPKYLLQLGCNEKRFLTHTFRFGPAFCKIANLILYAKEKSDQTQYGKYDSRPINWDPYRMVSGVPTKESIVSTERSILEDWESGQVTLIARKNTSLLATILPLFGFSFGDDDDENDDYESSNVRIYSDNENEKDIQRSMSQDSEDTIRSAPTPVSQDDESDEDDYLPYSDHHVDPDEYTSLNKEAASKIESLTPGYPKVHLNGKGQASGRNLWLKTLRQVESAFCLYETWAKDPDAVCLLDPKQFPDFENRRVSWKSFCDEVEAKEMSKYSNVIGVVSQCKGKTLEAMQTFREEVIMKDVAAEDADIILTTCHSAKGMEWNRVQLCDDFISLCTFEKKKTDPSPTSAAFLTQDTKRQKKHPQWKFGLQSWGDDVNLLYVACTRAMNELSVPSSSSLLRVAKSFDELHDWKLMKDANPAMVTSALSIDGVEKVIDEEDALGLYESLVVPLRHEYKLSADQRITSEIFGVSRCASNDMGDAKSTVRFSRARRPSGSRSHGTVVHPRPHLHMLMIVTIFCLLPNDIMVLSLGPKPASFGKNYIGMIQFARSSLSKAHSMGPPTFGGETPPTFTGDRAKEMPRDPASMFHDDMKRILSSKRNFAMEGESKISPSVNALTSQPLDRSQRPTILHNDVDGAIRVQSMLRHMVNIGVCTEESFQIVLEALVNRGRLRWRGKNDEVVCAADEVECLIDEVWERQQGKVSCKTCNLALAAYASCATPRGDRHYAEKAQSLLDKMIENNISPTEESYCYVINAWAWQQANREEGNCARLAQDNVEKLENLPASKESLIKAYDFVLEAWSRSSSQSAPVMAERALRRMEELSLNESEDSSASTHGPRTVLRRTSYTNAVLAWTKSRVLDGAPRGHALLMEHFDRYESGELEAPELLAVNSLIVAWSRSRRPDKAEEVLWRALDLKSDSLTPDILTFNAVLNSYLTDLENDPETNLQRMIAIVDYLKESGRTGLQPNAYSFRCLLKAWANNDGHEAALKTVEMIEKIHFLWEAGDVSLEPTNAYYNMALNKLARTDVCIPKVLEILHLLQASRFCYPDSISYTSVIEACSKSNDSEAPEIAMRLVEELHALYYEKGTDDMMPIYRTYTFAIQAMTKNPILINVVKARELLDRLVEEYETSKDGRLRPNSMPYNCVLNCAATCIGNDKDKLNAFQIATQTYNDLRKHKHAKPDSYTYFYWFKCCRSLLPLGELRTKCISFAFAECRKDGLVDERLLNGVPNGLVVSMLEKEPRSLLREQNYGRVTMKDLPPSWSRNVSKKFTN